MTRRTFLTSLGGAAALSSAKPNVLFISVDDMNDWIGCLNRFSGVQTPNLDTLSRKGVLFSNAHCASPLCNPSRTALYTGWASWRSGVYDNDQFWRPTLPGAKTIPMYLREHGYLAAGAGKTLHHTVGMNPPDQWDEYQLQVFDDPWYRRADWYPWNQKVPPPAGHPFNGLQNFPGEFDWGIPPAKESEYGDQRAIDFGEKFLARSHSKPFFLHVGLWHPHIPMYSPERFFSSYPLAKVRTPESPAGDLDDVPPAGQQLAAFRRVEFDRIVKEGKWRESVQAYLAAISFADSMVGRLLRGLETSAYANNTLVVFWSDNGWHLGEKQHFHKSTLWRRSTHVPLMVAGHGVRRAGAARKQAVSLLDLFPTLVEECGLPQRTDLDGESLSPLLRNPKAKHRPAVITYLEGNHAVCDDRWRYIRYRDGGEELYDQSTDPNEWRNLAGDARHASIKRDLARWLPETNAKPVPNRNQFDFDYATCTYRRK